MTTHPEPVAPHPHQIDLPRRLVTPIVFVSLVAMLSLVFALVGGVVTLNQLQRFAGRGPFTLHIVNLRDDDVIVTFNRPGFPIDFEEMIIHGDVRTYPKRPLSPLLVTFRSEAGVALGNCSLDVAGNGDYTFVVFSDGIAVAQSGHDTKPGAGLLLGYSPLCLQSST